MNASFYFRRGFGLGFDVYQFGRAAWCPWYVDIYLGPLTIEFQIGGDAR